MQGVGLAGQTGVAADGPVALNSLGRIDQHGAKQAYAGQRNQIQVLFHEVPRG
jgi:hypothetical protein